MSKKHVAGLLFVFLILSSFSPIFSGAAENVYGQSASISATAQAGTVTILFQELFEDTNFASRGWYDVIGGILSPTEHIHGSTRSLELRFLRGQSTPNGGIPKRHLLQETESVYVSYWVKYSSNWQGQPTPYGHHEFYLLTNQNDAWSGLAWTRLTAYIEQSHGVPLLSIQDGQNIDKTKVRKNLANFTENRAVAGCNGDSDGHGNGACYQCGSEYCNGKVWKAGRIYFSDSPGPYYKNGWHHVEAYFKLNSISNGKGVADGMVKYWYDNQLIIDHSDVLMRTAQHPNMKFNQFIIAPFLGDGSPVDQTFWIDNLIVATGRIETKPPVASTGLVVE